MPVTSFSSVSDQQPLPSPPATKEQEGEKQPLGPDKPPLSPDKPPLSPDKQPQSPTAIKLPPVAAGVTVPSQHEKNAEGPLSPKQKVSFTAKLVENDSKDEDEDDDASDLDTDDDDDDDGVDKIYVYLFVFIVCMLFFM